MNNPVKISVIVPNYNHDLFLTQRLESIYNQTYLDFEVILLDDASTDNSQDILEKYSQHLKTSAFVANEKNSGSVFKQWIKGISLAKGEYIWIAESDDYADFKFLETTIDHLEKNKRAAMVFTDTLKVDLEGCHLGLVSESKQAISRLVKDGGIINSENLNHFLLDELVIVNASSVLFRRDVLLALDFNVLERFKNLGDVFVYLGIGLKHDILFIHNPLNFMRLHQNNTTKKNKKNGKIYRDKLLVLNHYLEEMTINQVNKKSVLNYLLNIAFLCIDYGYLNQVRILMDRMFFFGYYKKSSFLYLKTIVFAYVYFTFKGKPYFLRQHLKFLLNKAI